MPKTGTLTKARIVKAVVESNGYTQQKAFETVEIMLELIKRSLENGEDVLISGFGKFCVKKKAERRGRNPATGEDMMMAPRKRVTFQWSGKLREKLNRKKATLKRLNSNSSGNNDLILDAHGRLGNPCDTVKEDHGGAARGSPKAVPSPNERPLLPHTPREVAVPDLEARTTL